MLALSCLRLGWYRLGTARDCSLGSALARSVVSGPRRAASSSEPPVNMGLVCGQSELGTTSLEAGTTLSDGCHPTRCGAWFALLGGVLGRSVGLATWGCLLWGLVCVVGWGFGAQCGPGNAGLRGGRYPGSETHRNKTPGNKTTAAPPRKGEAPPSNVALLREVRCYLWLLTGWTSGGNSSETAPATRLSHAARTAGSVGGVSSEITT